MKVNNAIRNRQLELIKTGLCNELDFIPLKITKFYDYTFNFNMDKETKSLLELAHKTYIFTQAQMERIERITKAVMLIDKEDTAQACHIAEAIQEDTGKTITAIL